MERVAFSWRILVLGTALLAITTTGCSSMAKKDAVPTLSELVSSGDAALAAGRVNDAVLQYTAASKADPVSKEPWLKLAQVQFDQTNYARAIVAAEEVLQRDPGDVVADSILTVSGLRMANQSLERLRQSGAITSSAARGEAETLVATLRETMGEEMLAPPQAEPARRPAARRGAARPAARPAAAPAQREGNAPANSSDPFRRIGGN